MDERDKGEGVCHEEEEDKEKNKRLSTVERAEDLLFLSLSM